MSTGGIERRMDARMRTRSTRTAFLGAMLAAAIMLSPQLAHAEPSAADKAAAEGLFDEARALMKEGRFADACPKLVASQRLDAGVGTLIYLADCYQRQGLLASSWATWREASAAARAAGQLDREKLAASKAQALEADVPRLLVRVNAKAPSLTVERDGTPLVDGTYGSFMPIDPGDHVVTARAPGRAPWSTTVKIGKGDHAEVTVPELTAETPAAAPVVTPPPPVTEPPKETPPPPPPEESAPPGRASKVVPWVGFGVAAAGLVTGGITGGLAFSSASSVKDKCTGNTCPPSSRSDLDSSRTMGTISTVAFIVGGVGAGVGVVSWVLTKGDSKATTTGSAKVGIVARPGGISIEGGF